MVTMGTPLVSAQKRISRDAARLATQLQAFASELCVLLRLGCLGTLEDSQKGYTPVGHVPKLACLRDTAQDVSIVSCIWHLIGAPTIFCKVPAELSSERTCGGWGIPALSLPRFPKAVAHVHIYQRYSFCQH